jgi:hypothetical protein
VNRATLIALVTGVFYWPAWVAGRLLFCIVWAGMSIAEGFTDGYPRRQERRRDGPEPEE